MDHPAFYGQVSQLRDWARQRERDKTFTFFPEGSYVWVPEKTHGYVAGKVIQGFTPGRETTEVAIVLKGRVQLRKLSRKQSSRVLWMDPIHLETQWKINPLGVDVSAAAMLNSIRGRFKEDEDYMQIGDSTLIYVNRFEDEEYRFEKIARSFDMEKSDTPTLNIESLAEQCFARLSESGGTQPQSCVVSGSPGSGAGETTARFMRKAVQLANPNDIGWWEKLLAANTVMKAFGGERYIPWVELHIEFPPPNKKDEAGTGKFIGAAFENFLLDVTNLTNSNSASFDCFYQLCGAAQLRRTEVEQEFNVYRRECYSYLNTHPSTEKEEIEVKPCKTPGCYDPVFGLTLYCSRHSDKIARCLVEDCDHAEIGDKYCFAHGDKSGLNVLGATRAWSETLASFSTLEITEREVRQIVHILSDVLRLGNIDIGKHKKYKGETYPGKLRYEEGKIFGVPLNDLIDALSQKKITVGTDVFVKPLKDGKANALRDALGKTIYSGLFQWLTKIINRGVSHTQEARQRTFSRMIPTRLKKRKNIGIIGALHTRGLVESSLEDGSNALEKLINNYNQERLFEFALQKELHSAIEFWESHGFTLPSTAPKNPVVSLILNKKPRLIKKSNVADAFRSRPSQLGGGNDLGVLEILEDEMLRPGGSDNGLVRKIEKLHANHIKLLPAKQAGTFRIRHFGADVTYSVNGFVHNTRSNILSEQVYQFILENTKDSFIVRLLTQHNAKEQQKMLDRLHAQNIIKSPTLKKTESVGSGMTEYSNGASIVSVQRGGSGSSQSSKGMYPPHKGRTVAQMFSMKGIGRKFMDKGQAKHPVNRPPPSIQTRQSIHQKVSNPHQKRHSIMRLLPGATENSRGSRPGDRPRGSIFVIRDMNKQKQEEKGQDFSKFHIGRSLQERSTIVENSMAILIELLESTTASHVYCFESNSRKDFNMGLDERHVLHQIRLAGLEDLFYNRVSRVSLGEGEPEGLFMKRYACISPKNTSSVAEFCVSLSFMGLLKDKAWKHVESGHVFLSVSQKKDLEVARMLARQDLAVYLQKQIRMLMTRMHYVRMFKEHIVEKLEAAIAQNDEETMKELQKTCKRWRFRPPVLAIAKAKLDRAAREYEMAVKLDFASAERDRLELYELIREAGKLGMIDNAAFRGALKVHGELEAEVQHTIQGGAEAFKKDFEGVLGELEEELEYRKNGIDLDELLEQIKASPEYAEVMRNREQEAVELELQKQEEDQLEDERIAAEKQQEMRRLQSMKSMKVPSLKKARSLHSLHKAKSLETETSLEQTMRRRPKPGEKQPESIRMMKLNDFGRQSIWDIDSMDADLVFETKKPESSGFFFFDDDDSEELDLETIDD